MKKSRKAVDLVEYNLEAWVMPKGEIYKFGLQAVAVPKDVKPHSWAVRFTEEFIEDFIDNEKRSDYLEEVALRVLENHLEDMLKLAPYSVERNMGRWFKEAKLQLDKGQDG